MSAPLPIRGVGLMGFLDDYEPVQDRLERFWKDHPEGRVVTDLLSSADGEFIVKASVWRTDTDADYESKPAATGLAQERVTSSGVNKTSALENCETSAIGRALANLGYAAKARPSQEEMAKTEPGEINWKVWVWEESAVLKDWSEDERKAAAQAAMQKVLDSADTIANSGEAMIVLNEMRAMYEGRQQGQLDV